MTGSAFLVVVVCSASSAFLLAQLRSIVVIWLRFKSQPPLKKASRNEWPSVVVQLPVYRERDVLHRLLSSVIAMDYPRDRLSVQVIDDSQGTEAAACEEIVRTFKSGPVRVDYLQRRDRTGYKAGALNHGLKQTTADLVAIFDADFEPSRDFLLCTTPYFQEPKMAAVQARWSCRNDLESPLTLLQAAVFDTLFCFENGVRSRLGLSSLFLGTGGVWRREVVETIGGWREFPFTAEDVDLTYRARVAGLRVAYEEKSLSSCELPVTYLAYKAQQRRWARGCFQVFLDYFPHAVTRGRVGSLEASQLLLQVALQAPILLTLAVSAYVILGLPRSTAWLISQLCLSTTVVLSPVLVELVLSQKLFHQDWLRRAGLLLRSLPFVVGLSVTFLAGFCDTLWSQQREFVRTPKQGDVGVILGSQRRWLRSAVPAATAELLLGLTALAGLTVGILRRYWESWPTLAFFCVGYLVSAYTSISEIRRKSHPGT